MGATERWSTDRDGRVHLVEIADAGLGKRLTWTVDEVPVTSRRTSDERVVLPGGESGAIGVRLPALVGPARRVTWYADELAAHAGLGGTDLDPEPGSRAAAREAWIREHPHLHVARRTVAAALGVLVPILVLWLLARVALPVIPWPDLHLPRIPLPDLPSIPWPDLPRVPWPDLGWPWVTLPEVPQWVKDAAKLVGPVVLAVALARGEVRRRRAQDEAKRLRSESRGDSDHSTARRRSEEPPADPTP